VELPDDVGADLAGGGQDPKEIPTCRWFERVSEASRILPKHPGASVSAAWPPGELGTFSPAEIGDFCYSNRGSPRLADAGQ
jgi:hypothetical protein